MYFIDVSAARERRRHQIFDFRLDFIQSAASSGESAQGVSDQ